MPRSGPSMSIPKEKRWNACTTQCHYPAWMTTLWSPGHTFPHDTKPLKFESGKIWFSSIGQLWVSTDVRKMTTISFLLSLLYQYHHPHSSSVTLDYILIPVFYGFAWSNSTSHVRINVSFAHFSHNYFCTFLLQCFEAMALGHPPAGLL